MSIPEQMRAAVITEFSSNGLCIQNAPVPVPKVDQVLVQMKFATTNPSDQLTINNAHPDSTVLPLVVGKKGSGIVVASGGGTRADQLVGKRVGIFSSTGCWSEFAVADAVECCILRDDIPFELGCFVYSNPVTAIMNLEFIRSVNAQAVVQNAAGSALGKMQYRLCQQEGIPMINIVRRPENAQELREDGFQNVLCSADVNFEQELQDLAQQLNATVCFDYIAGTETERLMRLMPLESTIVIVGILSSQKCQDIDPIQLIFGRKSLKGLVMNWWVRQKTEQELEEISNKVQDGLTSVFQTKVARTVGFDEFPDAYRHYETHMSEGKVLLRIS